MKNKGFRPKKRLGQHFLYDPAIAGRIVEAAGLSPDDVVVELGPGRGILTRPLAATGARVIALEVDPELHQALDDVLAAEFGPSEPSAAPRVEILKEDFTRVSIGSLLASRGLAGCVLMGNIPYYLTRDVLFSFLVDERARIRRAYLMLQREVGERIVSAPGSRVYGITSVILQSLYAVRSLFRVAPGSFNPRPGVESAVLEFRALPQPLVGDGEIDGFKRFVKNVFQQRRKTLHSTIKAFYSATEEDLQKIHAATGIDLGRRPEALRKEDLLGLARAVAEVVPTR